MDVRASRSMKGLIGADAESPESIRVACPAAAVADLQSGFKEVDGCIVPTWFEGGPIWSAARPRIDNQDDETGFECSLSKVHIEDFVGDHLPLANLTRFGIAYAVCLRDALMKSTTSGKFRIIVVAQLPNPDLDLSGTVCTVRYHKVRPNQIWLDDDLDAYQSNALLVIEFDAAAR